MLYTLGIVKGISIKNTIGKYRNRPWIDIQNAESTSKTYIMAGYLVRVNGCTVNLVLGLCLLMRSVTGLNVFTTTGWPACYIARTTTQSVPDLYNRCYYGRLSYPGRNTDLNYYYIYCSVDQECCYHDGYPACCTTKTEFKDKELFGLVLGCVAFVFIILGVALGVANKHCRTDEKDEL